MAVNGLHRALRDATAPLHRQLDHHPLLQPLTQPVPDRHGYAIALAALQPIHVAYQTTLAAWQTHFAQPVGLDARARLDALDADLATLDQSPFPLRARWPEADRGAALIGQRYVIDGSALGGLAIATRLDRTGSDLPRRFLAAGGADLPARWRALLAFAEQQQPDPAAVIDAACTLFHTLLDHLDQVVALQPVRYP